MADNDKKIVPYSEKSKKAVAKGKTRVKDSNKTSFKDLLIEDDISNVKSYVFKEVFMPGLKKIIANVLNTCVDMTFLGNSDGKKSSKKSGSYTSYSNYYKSYDDEDDDEYFDTVKPRKKRFHEIEFDNYEDAKCTYKGLLDVIKEDGYVTVAEYYELADQAAMVEHTDNKYGWKRLENTYDCIRKTTDGYFIIKLPRAMPV